MTQTPNQIPVLIVGAGPVGLTLALDLGFRDVPCLLIEQRADEAPTNPRCNTTGARSMEHFRRLGVADRIRAAGLPPDYPTDASYRTRLDGPEILRIELPSSAKAAKGDEDWPTPELQHRVSQIYLQPILRERLRDFPQVDYRTTTRLAEFTQDDEGVTAVLEDTVTGERSTVRAGYLVAADGGNSAIRRALGYKLEGDAEISRCVSMFVRAPELEHIIKDSWTTWTFNGHGTSNMMAINGRDLWLHHTGFPAGYDTSEEDPHALLERAIGHPVEFEELEVVRWSGRQLVATHYRDRRVLLAGDAAHIWIPMAGFGMNAGIQDATELAWMLAGVHHGWAPAELLDAYEAERKPIGDAIAQAVADVGRTYRDFAIDPAVEEDSERGATVRAQLAEEILVANEGQYEPVGLNFGYHYHGSPIVASEDVAPPPLRIHEYEPTAKPGCRLPHLWLHDEVSIFDRLGRDFTLIRVGDDPPAGTAITDAARRAGVPMEVLDVAGAEAAELYGARLLIVRPDQHVAWRGDDVPDRPDQLVDRIRGAALAVAP